MKKLALSGMVLFFPLFVALWPLSAGAAPVSVATQLDKTAIWVGDILRYTVRVVHDPNVELVLDNFKKDRLPLAPFVVHDIEIERSDWADGKKAAEIVLLLRTFETGKTELTIPPLQLYYFVHEPGLNRKESPVEAVTIPAVKIGLRSALVPEYLVPRTVKGVSAPAAALVLVTLALGCLGLLALAGHAGRGLWRRLHPDEANRQLTRQMREKIVQASLARVRAEVAAAGDDARRRSAVIAAALRGFIEGIFQIPAAGLTPEEIEVVLARSQAGAALIAEIKTVLTECERLHYGKNADSGKDADSGGAARAQLLQAAERIMQSPQLLSA